MILSFLHHYINKNGSAILKWLLCFSLFFILPKLLFGQAVDDLNKKELRTLVSDYAIKYDSLLELNTQLIKIIESKALELNYKNETLLKSSVDLKISNEKNDSLLKCIGSLNKEIDSLKLYASNEDNDLFLVYDNYMFIDSSIDTNTFKGDYFFKEESGVYTLLSKIDDSFLKPQFADLKNISLYFYDSSMNILNDSISTFYYFKKFTPNSASIIEWDSESRTKERVCADLKEYHNEDYLVASLKNTSSAVIASYHPVSLSVGVPFINNSLNTIIMNWISKQKLTIDYQKTYRRYKSGIWWKDKNSEIKTNLYMINNDNYFGITTIVLDGSDFGIGEDVYMGTNLTYIYSIKNGVIDGICDEILAGLENHNAFYNKHTMMPYFKLSTCLGSIFLCTETNKGWGIINTIDVGYFDCP